MTIDKNGGMSKFMVLRLLEKSKSNLHIFTYGPQEKFSPRFSSRPGRRISLISPRKGFSEIYPQQRGSREKLCGGTGCLCISTLLEILCLSLLRKLYIKLLPRMEDFFILVVSVGASITINFKFLKVVPRMI